MINSSGSVTPMAMVIKLLFVMGVLVRVAGSSVVESGIFCVIFLVGSTGERSELNGANVIESLLQISCMAPEPFESSILVFDFITNKKNTGNV